MFEPGDIRISGRGKGRWMMIYDSCQDAISDCLDTRTFAVAHLYNNEKTMDIHIHDTYEIYFSISGGQQFLIDNRLYEFGPNDIFFINQFESHHVKRLDSMTHERIVISVHPDFVTALSTEKTDLNFCFTHRDALFGHRLTLDEREVGRLMYYVHKLDEAHEYGQDVLDLAVFMEMLTFLNHLFYLRCRKRESDDAVQKPVAATTRQKLIDNIFSYVNQHLAENISIAALSEQFYLSGPYLCKVFKTQTGITINNYIAAKRISYAKELLMEGYSMTETCQMCGFGDYSNFFKTFTRIVGVSPKKYVSYLQK